MSKQKLNNQTITQYLLGSLPEAEAEALDELSFTDDEFANVLEVAEKDLVDAFVQGELSGAELEKFNSYYLASPLRREKVEFAQAFQSFVEESAAAQAAEVRARVPAQAATKRKISGWSSALSVFTARRSALQWGTAFAALALLIAGSLLVFENMRQREQASQTRAQEDESRRRERQLQKELEGRHSIEDQHSTNARNEQELARESAERERSEQELKQPAAQARRRTAAQRRAPAAPRPSPPGAVSVASFILTPQMRATGQIQTLSVPARTRYVAVQLELEPNDYTAYRVALLDQSDNQTLWRSNRLKAKITNDGQTLGIRLPAGLLSPQVYRLRVSGVEPRGAAEIIGDYPFRVVE